MLVCGLKLSFSLIYYICIADLTKFCIIPGTNRMMTEGSVWNDDPCTKCTCEDGKASCWTSSCDIKCVKPKYIPTECCPVCDGKHIFINIHIITVLAGIGFSRFCSYQLSGHTYSQSIWCRGCCAPRFTISEYVFRFFTPVTCRKTLLCRNFIWPLTSIPKLVYIAIDLLLSRLAYGSPPFLIETLSIFSDQRFSYVFSLLSISLFDNWSWI